MLLIKIVNYKDYRFTFSKGTAVLDEFLVIDPNSPR